MKKIILALVATVAITGCATNPGLESNQTHFTGVPSALVLHCTVPAPILPNDYLVLDYKGKEDALTKYIRTLLFCVGVQNVRLDQIKDWSDQQVKLYEGTTK